MKKWTPIQRQNRLLIPGLVLLIGTILVLTYFFINAYRQGMQEEADITGITEAIRYYDEALTMSANMAALTGEVSWEERYARFLPKLDEAIQEAASHFPVVQDHVLAIDQTNQVLVAMEQESFRLSRLGQLDEAQGILFGEEYQKAKGQYADHLESLRIHLENHRTEIRTGLEQALLSTEAILLLLALLVVSILVVGFRLMSNRLRGEKLTADISARLISGTSEEINQNLQWILDQLRLETKADQAYLVHYANGQIRKEWEGLGGLKQDRALSQVAALVKSPPGTMAAKVLPGIGNKETCVSLSITEAIAEGEELQLLLVALRRRIRWSITYQYILKSLTEILAQAMRQQLHEDQLYRLATTDSLTGKANRRHFLEILEREYLQHRRNHQPLSVLVLDLDHFKVVNDTYGHDVGDRVIRDFARSVSSCLREADDFGRIGGEEFAVCLPNTDTDSAREVAERIRRTVEDAPTSLEGSPVCCTVSIGVTTTTKEDEKKEDLLKRGDLALYVAKEAGRNRVEVR